MTPDEDDEASNRSVNESDKNPEVQTTAASGRTTSTVGFERFTSVAVKKAVRRSNAHAERAKQIKTEMKTNPKSSQTADRLADGCAVLDITSLKVVQDVKTRWWSTQGLVEHMVYLMKAIKLHGRLDDSATPLSSVEWCKLRLLPVVLDPVMCVQKKLESDRVTESLVVPLIWDLRAILTDMLDDITGAVGKGVIERSEQSRPCVAQALVGIGRRVEDVERRQRVMALEACAA